MLDSKRTLLKGINYIDVEYCCVNYNEDILFQNETIIDVGKSINCQDCTTINCSNLFAIPAFIDMHVHVTFNPYGNMDMALSCACTNLTEAAQTGICLVRDVGTKKSWTKNDILKCLPHIPLPNIVMSGEPLCVDNGHGISYGTVIDSSCISQWIFNHKEQGCEWIKIMNDPENHSEIFLKKVVEEAHKIGLKVACHVFRKKGLDLAISCGCDSIEHVVPVDYNNDEKSLFPYYVPTAYSAWISCQKSYLDAIEKKEAEYLLEWYELLKKNFSSALKNNVHILCGTDAGCCPSSFKDLPHEIKMLHNMGLSKIEAIKSATINSAKCLGYDDLFGSIKKGKYANIIVFPKNPLEDMNILNYPCLIFLKGVLIRDEVSGPWN